MTKIQKKIEIVRTPFKKYSLMSIPPSESIKKALQETYVDVRATNVSSIEELQEVVGRRPDLCFLGIKQLPVTAGSEELMWISDFLDEQGMAYTGSSSKAISLDFNKHDAKKLAIEAGLKTSKYFIGRTEEDLENSDLAFPLFIKPTNQGNKMGVDSNSVVHDISGYNKKIRELIDLGFDPLVEEYLTGREFSVGILESIGSPELITLPVEIIVGENDRGDRIIGLTDDPNMPAQQVLAVPDEKINNEICTLAKDIFKIVGGRDYGRIDIRLNKEGVAYFLEANLIPALGETHSLPTGNLLNHSIGYSETIQSIAALALTRQQT